MRGVTDEEVFFRGVLPVLGGIRSASDEEVDPVRFRGPARDGGIRGATGVMPETCFRVFPARNGRIRGATGHFPHQSARERRSSIAPLEHHSSSVQMAPK
jgi:hypothetical protein